MKPDLLITWHESCDYPIARLFLNRHRDFFGKIIIYFSKHFRHPVYTQFLKNSLEHLGNIEFLDPVEYEYGVEDWRNVSTHEMLKHSTSEWVCSIEQDWFASNWSLLLDKTNEAMKTADLVGWWHPAGKYIHPSYWFIKREMLEKTKKDFAARVPHDHFGWISEDVIKLGGKIISTQDMGFVDFMHCFHLGGVNQNYLEGLKSEYVFHRPDWFYVYNYWSLQTDVAQDVRFVQIMNQIHKKLKPQFPEINPRTDKRSIYFNL